MFLKVLVIGCLVAMEINYTMSEPQGCGMPGYFCPYFRPELTESGNSAESLNQAESRLGNSAAGKGRFKPKFEAFPNNQFNAN